MTSDENCLFCKIIKKEIPSEIVYEDNATLAFLDINPRNPGHLLVIPKNHYVEIFEAPDADLSSLITTVKKMASAAKTGMKADGISITQSNGQAAGQVINHLHFHVIPRFLSEGPQGLEAILPTKKMTNEMIQEVKKSIMANLDGSLSGGGSSSQSGGASQEEDPFGF